MRFALFLLLCNQFRIVFAVMQPLLHRIVLFRNQFRFASGCFATSFVTNYSVSQQVSQPLFLFRIEAKQSETNTLFRIDAKKISHQFRIVSHRCENSRRTYTCMLLPSLSKIGIFPFWSFCCFVPKFLVLLSLVGIINGLAFNFKICFFSIDGFTM